VLAFGHGKRCATGRRRRLDAIVGLVLTTRRAGIAVFLISYAGLVAATKAFVDEPWAWEAMAIFGILPAALIWLSIYRRLAAGRRSW
jgi:hypothetical protein